VTDAIEHWAIETRRIAASLRHAGSPGLADTMEHHASALAAFTGPARTTLNTSPAALGGLPNFIRRAQLPTGTAALRVRADRDGFFECVPLAQGDTHWVELAPDLSLLLYNSVPEWWPRGNRVWGSEIIALMEPALRLAINLGAFTLFWGGEGADHALDAAKAGNDALRVIAADGAYEVDQ
jgi:hypothetical protein